MRLLLRFAEGLGLVWWGAALAATYGFTLWLPYLPATRPPSGCILRSYWFRYVDCGFAPGEELLGGLLSLALYWTHDLEIVFEFSILAPPWLITLGLAISGSVRLARRALQGRSR